MESEEDFRNVHPTAISGLNSVIVYKKKKGAVRHVHKNLKKGGEKKKRLLDGGGVVVFYITF